jgi:hypothetical protein
VLENFGQLPFLIFFSTHASAIAEMRCRFLFGDEEAGVADLPSKGWSEGDIVEEGEESGECTSFLLRI